MLSVGKLTVFNSFLEIFALKYGSFSLKNLEKEKIVKIPAILRRKKITKKALLSTKPRGVGAKGLSGLSTKKRTFFCGFHY